MPFVHPVARAVVVGGVLFLGQGAVSAGFAIGFIGGPAVVVVVHHLGLVERQPTLVALLPGGAGFDCADVGKVFVSTKQAAVIRHMEHSLKTNAHGFSSGASPIASRISAGAVR